MNNNTDLKSQIDQIKKTTVKYICAKCHCETEFRIKEESICCSNCRCRVLYKKRTSEPVEFEAR